MSELHPHDEIRSSDGHETEILAAIHETLGGNRNAFRVIVDRYSPVVHSLCVRMLGNRDDAREAAQDIFIKIFTSLHKFKMGNKTLPWVYTIAINHLRTRYKKKKNRESAENDYKQEQINIEQAPALETDPALQIIRNEEEQLIHAALSRISGKYREVFVLREIENLSVKETAVVLKIPEGTVKTNLFRAKQAIIKNIVKKVKPDASNESI
ncbi:MAG: RNA polymerase sigma factor [Spirochaetales bacterium]|nr:RNA polymerase sigma factor [Spirochaetales bacterium]